MDLIRSIWLGVLGSSVAVMLASAPAIAQQQKPNIVVIMGADIGMWNIGAYRRGMMVGKTPNLDKIAREGMLFTNYYAEASCTAGRANFVTGELPIRTGMTTVGQAGASVGLPAEAVTIATVFEWLTCLEMARDVIKTRKDNGSPVSEASTVDGRRRCPIVQIGEDGSVKSVVAC